MKNPHEIFTPRVFQDGNWWCALYGENLDTGVVGFGDTPAKAIAVFDHAWLHSKVALPTQTLAEAEWKPSISLEQKAVALLAGMLADPNVTESNMNIYKTAVRMAAMLDEALIRHHNTKEIQNG